ncbi:hypothetical protein IRJ41_017835, partial [Triplophysa rosa]
KDQQTAKDAEEFALLYQENDFIPEAQETEVKDIQEPISTVVLNQHQRKSPKKRGKQAAVKRSWTPDECAAVERHLKKFIVRNQVPGKIDCESCIDAEPQTLGTRDWKSVGPLERVDPTIVPLPWILPGKLRILHPVGKQSLSVNPTSQMLGLS